MSTQASKHVNSAQIAPTDYRVVIVSAPSIEVATEISKKILEKRLAACCNIIPQVQSLYHWDNQIQHDTEVIMLIKTKADLFTELALFVGSIHPYTTPEIIALDIKDASVAYLRWIEKEASYNPTK